MPLSTGLSELLTQAVQPLQPGRRYPSFSTENVQPGLDIPGEILQPRDLPNPLGVKHLDPMELPFIRPYTTIDSYPWPS